MSSWTNRSSYRAAARSGPPTTSAWWRRCGSFPKRPRRRGRSFPNVGCVRRGLCYTIPPCNVVAMRVTRAAFEAKSGGDSMAFTCVDCRQTLTDDEARFNVIRCNSCAGSVPNPTSTAPPVSDEAQPGDGITLSEEERDELFGTAFVSPWWIARAPWPVRLLLFVATLPGIILALVTYLLSPFGWLVNVLTGHRFNSSWGLMVVLNFRTVILMIVPTWLFTFLWQPLVVTYAIWILVYLILRQFNGAADHERRLHKAMEAEEKLLERLRRS